MKKFFLSTIMALACVGANAQVETTYVSLGGESFYCIPEEFNYDFRSQVVTVVFGGDDGKTAGDMYVYDENLKIVKNIKVTERPLSHSYMRANSNSDYASIYLTQTLFNNDEKFEYIVGISEKEDYLISGIKIMSEDGAVLQTIDFGTIVYDDYFEILSIGETNYLCVQVKDNDNDKYFINAYKINKSSDPSKVSIATAPVRINVSPRVAERGQDITVAAEGEGVREIVVTDAAGRVVYRTKATAGQQTVKINSQRLSSGLNVVSVKGADGKSENCKVIVKK